MKRGGGDKEIYKLTPSDLEPFWEAQWNATGKDANNPKIRLTYVRAKGARIHRVE